MKRLYFLFAFVCIAFIPAAAFAKTPQLHVTAEAEVRVPPDRAAITFGLFEKTDNLRQGAERLNTASSQILQYLRTRGVEERFIQADNLQILPVYATPYANRPRPEKLQYEISQTFTVTLEDPSQYEDVLYALLERGVNRITNVSFYSTQLRRYRDQARSQAIGAAREKARLMAEAAGVKIGKLLSLREEAAPSFAAPRWTSNSSQNVLAPDAPAPADNAPATGMISIRAAVAMTYQIK